MAKSCTYTYLDEFGNPSEDFYSNKIKYGEDMARTMFISEQLKNDIPIRFNKDIDISTRLKTRTSYKKLSKQGYIGPTSLINNSAKLDPKKEQSIIDNVAINLKVGDGFDRPKVVEYFKYDQETLQPMENIEQFNGLRKDAKRINEIQIAKGNLVHLLFQNVLDARLKAKNKKQFNSIFAEGVKTFKITASSVKGYKQSDMFNAEMFASLKLVLKQLITDVEALGDDFELYSEVSLFSDDIKYDKKPMQGHIDILAYSPSTNKGYIIDIKTKTAQSFLNFDNPYGKKNAPFDTISNSSLNNTAIQTSIYAILAKQALNIDIIGSKVLLLTNSYTHNNGKAGEKDWKLSHVDHVKTELKDLPSLEGDVTRVIDKTNPRPLGEKNAEMLISEMFDDKLVTITGTKDTFISSQELRIKEKNGKFIWYDVFDRTNTIVKDSKEEVIEEMGPVYEKHLLNKKHAARDLVELFNTGITDKDSIWASYQYSKKAMSLLNRFSKKTHKMESASNLQGIGDDIIIVTDLFTGEVILMSITMTYDTSYNFNETDEESVKSTIYGPSLDDADVIKRYRHGNIPAATTQNLNKLKLTMLAAELKLMDPVKYANISELISTSLLEDSDKTYEYANITEQMGHLTEIHKLMKENGRVIPQELGVIVEKSELLKPDSLTTNYFDIFTDKMRKGLDPLKMFLKDHPNLKESTNKTLLANLKKSINTYIQDKYDLNVYDNISQHLGNYVKVLYGHLLLEHKSPERVYNDSRYAAANRAFLSFKQLMVAENPSFRKNILGSIHSLTTAGNEVAESVHLSISSYEQQARDMIIESMTEHQTLQKALMDETPGVNNLTSIFKKDNFKKVFGPMLKDGYDFNKDNVHEWMQFKDISELKTPAQKAYVKFYNHTVKSSVETIFGKNKKEMMYQKTSPDAIEKWGEGSIPIISSTANLDLQEVSLSRQGIDASFQMIKKILTRGSKSTVNPDEQNASPWEFSSLFPEQYDNSPGRGSKQSRYLLNVTEDGTIIEDKRNIELNPAAILNVMLVEAARKKHMAVAAFTAYAIDAELAYKQEYAGIDTAALRELIKNIVMIRVHGKVQDDGQAGKVIDTAKNLVSIGMFWGSVGQTITEIGTAAGQITSQSIANILNKTLFKGDNKYNNKDLAWSAKLATTALGRQVITDLGMYNTNLGEFTDSEYVETQKKSLYQTKWGFWAIRNTLRQATQSVIFAQMHKEGITENVYVLDTKTGKYHYDETKDTNRFYVYDPESKIEGQKTKAPTSEEDKSKHKLWLAHRKQLLLEGGINVKTNKMTRPFITAQLQSMKNQSIRMLGAMDNSEAMSYEITAMGRAMGTYKRWIVQKAANYWTPTHKSFKEGRWDLGSDGEVKYIEEDFEGILQSIIGITKDIKKFGLKDTYSNLSDIRKRNVSKFLADLLVTAAMMYLLSLLKDSILNNDGFGKELMKGLTNASSDVMPVIAVGGAITGSPMAAISIALNTSQNIFRTIIYGITGDLENTMSSADKAINIVGAYRATKSFANLIIEN